MFLFVQCSRGQRGPSHEMDKSFRLGNVVPRLESVQTMGMENEKSLNHSQCMEATRDDIKGNISVDYMECVEDLGDGITGNK